jgi:hypothetical protein
VGSEKTPYKVSICKLHFHMTGCSDFKQITQWSGVVLENITVKNFLIFH